MNRRTVSSASAARAVLAIAAALAITVGCGPTQGGSTSRGIDYPAARAEPVVESVHGVEVADPYRWLESADAADVVAWLDSEDSLARRLLEARQGRDQLRLRLERLAYVDAVSPPWIRGERLFYGRRHADREKGTICWRDGEAGEERVLLDPNAMSADGSVSLGVVSPDHDGHRVAYSLRRNNADAATLYVLDVDTGEASEVDVIEGAKYAVPQWTPDGAGFYYTALPTDPSIPADILPGQAQIKYHALGSDPAADPVVFDKTDDPSQFLGVELSDDGRYLIVYRQTGWVSSDVFYSDLSAANPSFRPLAVGLSAQMNVEVHDDRFYVVTNLDAPRWRVLRIDPNRPEREHWEEIIPQSAEATISDDDGLTIVGGHLLVSYIANASSRLELFSIDGDRLKTIELPGIGTVGRIRGRADDGRAFFEFSSFTTPARVYRTSVPSGVTELWSEITLPIDAAAMTTEQVWYRSKDGTRVSMFLVHRRGLRKTGDVPTLMFGYGGFNIGLTPSFNPWIYPLLERGGLYVVPNLRGGSEYGEEWHRAGMLTRKQNVFDDFVAAAEWLIAERYTRRERLAIYGRSNGGLLVGAAMTQRPDLFRAVICGVPLLDMVRYHLFGSGRTWVSEYGSADDPEQFRALYAYSPYHHVRPGTAYPALLMLSTDSDDRVDPMHARKFVAAVQAAQAADRPVLLRVERNAGHAGADMVVRNVEKWTDIYSFLAWQLDFE